MNNEEIKKLVAKVKQMDDDCELILSNKQLDWLWDLIEHSEKGRFEKFSENALKFLQNCERGFYSSPI